MGNTNRDRFIQRKNRVRAKIRGTSECPRLSVFRSNKFLSAQIINDDKSVTLVSVTTKNLKETDGTKTSVAGVAGEKLAKDALKKKIKKVVFDRRGYKYHGRVKALAEGARKGGLEF
jgi:large subunit ribosomal protein L18